MCLFAFCIHIHHHNHHPILSLHHQPLSSHSTSKLGTTDSLCCHPSIDICLDRHNTTYSDNNINDNNNNTSDTTNTPTSRADEAFLVELANT